ncbi:MAG: glycosyltransferase family 4 protein [Rhizonema sp. PD37]|nr:glycosyltransferase family 4 protein [Rhizonema sp. PD37]
MHILVLEPEPSSTRGGQEVVLFDFCRGLQQRGHQITLIYNKEGNLLKHYQEFCRQTLKVNRFIIYRPSHLFSFVADLKKVIDKVPLIQNTIILCNQFQDTPFGHALSLSQDIPLVCYLHLPPPLIVPKWQWNKGPKGVKHFISLSNIQFQWNLGLKGVQHFIAVSNQTKLDWVKRGYKEDIIDVVHNGIHLDVYKPLNKHSLMRKEWNIPEHTRVISYVGRIDQVKGLETLLKAFASLLLSTKAKLLIAGKPLNQGEEYQKSLEELAINLGIENHVNFLGHITNTTSLYQISDITVLPSLWSEPFGRVIVESMASGTPVVASRIGGISEVLTGEFKNGLFEPGNERDLSATLSRMMDWRDRDPHLAQRCRQHIISKFGVDKMVDGIEKVLEKISCEPERSQNYPKSHLLLMQHTGGDLDER